jgi:rhamnogalacturonyl hydrolase YesR
MKVLLEKSIDKLEKWIEDHDYKGYEPFDGLSSYLKPLTVGNLFLERVLQQLVRQCPFNLRPLLGVKPLESTKGRGYITWGYIKMFQLTEKKRYRAKTEEGLAWLDKNKSPLYAKHSWGNHFEYSARGGRIPKDESTIVWTGLIGQAFLDAFELFGEKKYLEIANSACGWILDLSRLESDCGICLNYTAYGKESTIHNSNMIGAALLARTGKIIGNAKYLEVSREAMKYSCSDQLPNGAWYYGAAPMFHWVDSFHTGYNLDALKCYIENTDDESFIENLERGFRFFKEHFFEENGRPKYYNNRAYPIDIQCASQAIETLVNFSVFDETNLELAVKVAKWTIENMQDQTGYFWYRILPIMKVKIPMIHWGQATMFKSLSYLLLKLNEKRT